MATNSKQRVLSQLFTCFAQQQEVTGKKGKNSLPVLEQFIFGICREGVTPAQAEAAFRRLLENFFDWNEIRVSSVREVAEALGDLPAPESRAQRIISFLQEVFELHYSFDLESLHKKGLKVAAKQLARYEAADSYHIAWVTQRSLGGHAIPVDEPTKRVARRLGLIDESNDEDDSVRSTLEHHVPKAKGTLFTDAVSVLAAEYCRSRPLCEQCPMNESCPKQLEPDKARSAATVS